MNDGATIEKVPLDRETWRRLAQAITTFAGSECGGKAIALFVLLLGFLLAINGLNVLNSFVGRDFMTAIARRDHDGFVHQAIFYVGVFAVSTVAAVLYRFVEERLGLLWREWMSRQLVRGYLGHQTYYRLNAAGTVPNPDQRIADDVRAFSTMTLSLLLMFLSGLLTIVSFGSVLWSISMTLFWVAVGYAVAGSLLTVFFGRPLIWLTYRQSDYEANFRGELTRVIDHAESVALMHHEDRLQARLIRHIDALTGNLRRIIAVNRNLGFFTTGYNYLIQVVPVLIVAPLFLRGEIEFGVITQSTMAFSHLMGAFSLVVTQFPSISSYAALLARVSTLVQATRAATAAGQGAIAVVERDDCVAYEGLTLRSPRDDRVLVEALDVRVPPGTRVLVRSPEVAAKVALLRATAGLWMTGSGRIVRPASGTVLFVAERPYLPPGTLREILVHPGVTDTTSEQRILDVLRSIGLPSVVERAGGLDQVHDWDDILSLEDLQLLCVARVLLAAPRFAFLDRLGTALGAARVADVLRVLAHHDVTYVTIGNSEDDLASYDAVLDLAGNGAWSWTLLRPDRPAAGTTVR